MLMEKSSQHLICSQGLSMRQIRFRFDGQPINETDTPAQVQSLIWPVLDVTMLKVFISFIVFLSFFSFSFYLFAVGNGGWGYNWCISATDWGPDVNNYLCPPSPCPPPLSPAFFFNRLTSLHLAKTCALKCPSALPNQMNGFLKIFV